MSEQFKTFSPSGRADIPANAPEELAAISTLELIGTPMTTTPEQRAEWAVDARVYGSSRATDGSIHMIALASIAKNVVPALISHIEALEAENARLKEALAWFHHNGKALASDIYSAHRLRGNGASQWMTEDDRDFRRDLDAALDRARAAMGESE